MSSRFAPQKPPYSDGNLPGHDTQHLEVRHRGDPVLAALGSLFAPARRPGLGEERLEVANAEEHVALEPEAGAGQYGVTHVPADRGQRVLLHHGPGSPQLLAGFGIVDAGDEFEALRER